MLPYKHDSLKFSVLKDSNQNITGISMTENTNNFKITYLDSQLVSHQFILNQLVTIKPINKIDMCIIECDLIPHQYINNKLKRIIKVINFGNQIYNLNSNELLYYNFINEHITSINITISFLNNLRYVYDFKKTTFTSL